mmetsp:Transcript_87085/g.230592  ORF Transcript_87085/g.230592 Transcript_87085/m.230592 type:complete len:89 (-) Transcript_87085:169-435(-)
MKRKSWGQEDGEEKRRRRRRRREEGGEEEVERDTEAAAMSPVTGGSAQSSVRETKAPLLAGVQTCLLENESSPDPIARCAMLTAMRSQ